MQTMSLILMLAKFYVDKKLFKRSHMCTLRRPAAYWTRSSQPAWPSRLGPLPPATPP